MSYTPKGIKYIHPVRSWAKVKRMVRDTEAGAAIPPILVDGDMLLTGTHRWVSNELLEKRGSASRIPVVEMQLLPLDVSREIEDALRYRDFWQVQNVFEYWWFDQDGADSYHLVRSDAYDRTQETPEVAKSRHLRKLIFECESCAMVYPDSRRKYECCDGPNERYFNKASLNELVIRDKKYKDATPKPGHYEALLGVQTGKRILITRKRDTGQLDDLEDILQSGWRSESDALELVRYGELLSVSEDSFEPGTYSPYDIYPYMTYGIESIEAVAEAEGIDTVFVYKNNGWFTGTFAVWGEDFNWTNGKDIYH